MSANRQEDQRVQEYKNLDVAWEMWFQMVIERKFFSYINPDITVKNFPASPEAFTDKKVIDVKIPRSMSRYGALKFLDERNLRAAMLPELLRWRESNKKRLSNCMVVALGSEWEGLNPCIFGHGSYLDLCLSYRAFHSGNFGSHYTIGAVEK